MRSLLFSLIIVSGSLSAGAFGAELPAEVDQALQTAEANQNLVASFSMKVSSADYDALTYRYDASQKTWTLIEGDESDLDKETLKEMKSLKEDMQEPGELTYGDLRDSLNIKDLQSETTGSFIYTGEIIDKEDPMPKAMRKATTTSIHVSKDPSYISSIQIIAAKPFKPVPVAKINTLNIIQDFTLPEGFPTAVISKYDSEVSGSAMMQKFNEAFTIEFFDYELIN